MEIVVVVVMVLFVIGTEANGCGPCIKSECLPPTGCLAGMVNDSCNCCYTCGRREGEKCDHPNVTAGGFKFGRCGEGLICHIRVDLPDGDPEEAWCVCQQTSKLCGSDGVTYENQCQLTEERYKKRNGLKALSRGPCRFAPEITTLPTDIRNTTGSQAAFFCEAIGWPLPNIEWKKESDGIFYDLPGENTHIAVQSRNGNYEVSSWLQFVQIKVSDIGTYWCRATNIDGEAEASAQLYILPAIHG